MIIVKDYLNLYSSSFKSRMPCPAGFSVGHVLYVHSLGLPHGRLSADLKHLEYIPFIFQTPDTLPFGIRPRSFTSVHSLGLPLGRLSVDLKHLEYMR